MLFEKQDWVLGKVLQKQSELNGDLPFIQFEDGPMHTYREAHELSNRVGNAFIQRNVAFSENVALMLDNCLEYLWCWIGLSRIGAVPVAINTALKGNFLKHVLTNTNCRIGVFEDKYLEWLVDIEDDLPNLEEIYVIGVVKEVRFKRIRLKPFQGIMTGQPNNISIEINYRDIAAIMFTSGTTGPSKGVLMPHAHLFLFGECLHTHMRITTSDKYYITLPLFHAQGLAMMTYGTMIAGASAVLTKTFRASTWMEDIKKYEITLTNLLGAMNDFVLAQPACDSDSKNHLRMVCALPVSDQTLHKLRTRFKIPKFFEAYGMTECNIPISRPFDAPDTAGCSGKVWDEYFEVIIADPNSDEELPVGEVGEILVRPKEAFCFMQAYNKMPDRTVETWRNMWFHTGDAGRKDSKGFVWYVDRIKDTIRRRGENISSYEVEAILLQHPAIVEAAAVAVEADQGGEDEVLACIVLQEGHPVPKLIDLMDFCAARMPHFCVPRYVEFFDDLPKTPNSKIKKDELRKRGRSPRTLDREDICYTIKK